MTTAEIRMYPGGSPVAGWNQVQNAGTSGLKIADLLDTEGASTGWTFSQTGSFSGTSSTSWATSSPDANWPLDVFRAAFYKGVADQGTVAFTIGNLPVGFDYSLECAGNGFVSDARDTSFFATGGTPSPAVYDNSSSIDPVTQPVTITGTVPPSGEIEITMTTAENFIVANGFRLTVTEAAAGPSITTADNITTEGQTATFTLSGNTAAPVSATLNGTDVGALTDQGAGVYSYTAPLIADDDTADLVVSVDGTTASATIAYANSYDRDQLTHPATEAEYSENSLSYPNAYATTKPYEWKVIADANASVVTINWNALEADDGFHKDVASYATPVANGVTTVTLGVFISETGQAYQFDRTITVSDGSVVVSSEDGAVGAALTPAISDAIEDAIA